MNEAAGRTADTEGGERELPSLVSVAIPAYNEAANLRTIVAEVTHVLDACEVDAEIIIVDDGSTDGTFEVVRRLSAEDPRVKGIRFSRNFGKEAALLAGLRAAQGQVVITMDADLQHPAAVIPELLKKWQEGAQVVHAVKRSREKDPWLVRQRAAAFNFVMTLLTGIDLKNSSDFKLLDRIAVDAITHALPEHRRFYRGLAAWIGYKTATVPFDVAARDRGEAKMSLRQLFSLAMVAVVTFTAAPLRIVTILGFLTLGLAVVVGTDALLSWWRGSAVSGFATLILVLLAIGSSVMISLGIIGEYLAKIYEEVKARPTYLIESCAGFGKDAPQHLDAPPSHLGDRAAAPTRRTHSRRCPGDIARSRR